MIKEKLQDIFREVFDDSDLMLREDMTAKDIEEWDSLAQSQLSETIEKEFDVSFTAEEIADLDTVRDFIELTEEKVKKPVLKKLLMLGGARAQMPAIKRAKELGYYVITCDYLPDNPGHKISDEYKNISTVEKEQVLQFAKERQIDGVIAYASDPSAMTAAYVSDCLKLPGSSYNIVRMMCEKDLFRKFQKENGFKTPSFISLSSLDELKKAEKKIAFPCVVKPVDSSGSRGVSKVENGGGYELEEAFMLASNFSRCGRVIIEDYIPTPYFQLHGDGVVYNGKIQFLALGDQRFRHSVPIGSSLPSILSNKLLKEAEMEVSRLIECIGFSCGGINAEVRVTEEGDIYIIEIGPRTGGNYIPQLMQRASKRDEMTAVLQMAMGDPHNIGMPDHIKCYFQYIIGSDEAGRFQEVLIDRYMSDKVEELYIHKEKDEWIEEYENSNGVVGVALIRFDNMMEMEQDIENIKQHIQVVVGRENK